MSGRRVDNVIKSLEMMGYEVIDNKVFQYIRIFLPCKTSNKVLSWTSHYFELNEDFCVERIVREFNGTIKSDF